ncbi:hypothetical protein OHS18_13755 [Amycolatopsis sp. NBC_00355]|uniref:hypothetical protein n=1 Tax=Amycolatopsis sp. NBC_00355 TaxID=2975957 RepID=UPI002E25D750
MNDQTGGVPDHGGADERDQRDETAAHAAREEGKMVAITRGSEVVRQQQQSSNAWGERAASQLDQARLVLRAVRRLVLAAASVVAAVLFLIAILAPL